MEARALESREEELVPFEYKEPPAGRISFEQFLDWCTPDTFADLIDGEVVLHSPVSNQHDKVTTFLQTLLNLYVTRRRLGRVLSAPSLTRLTETSAFEPDLMFVKASRARMMKRVFVDGPPDLVIEVVSPSNPQRDRRDKFQVYAEAGVREYWMPLLKERSVEFYQLSRSGKFQRVLPDSDGWYESREIGGLRFPAHWLVEPPTVDQAIETLGLSVPKERLDEAETRAASALERAARLEALLREHGINPDVKA